MGRLSRVLFLPSALLDWLSSSYTFLTNLYGVKMKPELNAAIVAVRVLRMGGVCHKIGLKRSTIHAMVASGKFPKPFQLVPGGRAVGWEERSVDEWLAERKVNSV